MGKLPKIFAILLKFVVQSIEPDGSNTK